VRYADEGSLPSVSTLVFESTRDFAVDGAFFEIFALFPFFFPFGNCQFAFGPAPLEKEAEGDKSERPTLNLFLEFDKLGIFEKEFAGTFGIIFATGEVRILGQIGT